MPIGADYLVDELIKRDVDLAAAIVDVVLYPENQITPARRGHQSVNVVGLVY